MKPHDLYRRLFEEVRRRQQWSRPPARWNSEKGVVWFDSAQPNPKALITYSTFVTARLELLQQERHLLSADIQWEDRSRSPEKTRSRPFFDHLVAHAPEIEAMIRERTGMPGIVRVNANTALSKSMMEAGFVHERGLDLHDPARLDEYVSWVVAVSPIARGQWIVALNTFVRTLT